MNEQILSAVKALHMGQVVAHPTETCYGLAVDIFQAAAVRRLYSLKKMPLDKPVSVLVRDLEEAQRYGDFSPLAVKLALKYWPGALTIVVPRRSVLGHAGGSALPAWINPSEPTVGFRVSSNKWARRLVEGFGGPVTTTSANLSGALQAYSVQEMLGGGLVPDFVLDGGSIGVTPPSTIVKVVGDEITVIRQGELEI
ncbi:MAG: L-threonylcarbamoyladenylate synthase [Candidatus Gracilibacteria bacterium]|jgi:L-threonylcarbamoyladenylate synthase